MERSQKKEKDERERERVRKRYRMEGEWKRKRWRSVRRLPLVSLLDECESGATVCFRFLSTVREI